MSQGDKYLDGSNLRCINNNNNIMQDNTYLKQHKDQDEEYLQSAVEMDQYAQNYQQNGQIGRQ